MQQFVFDDRWIDYLGIVLTVLGFGLTLWQLLRTKKVAIAAKEAATSMADRMRRTQREDELLRIVNALEDLINAIASGNVSLTYFCSRRCFDYLHAIIKGHEISAEVQNRLLLYCDELLAIVQASEGSPPELALTKKQSRTLIIIKGYFLEMLREAQERRMNLWIT